MQKEKKLKPNKARLRKWVKALRSGKFKQVKHQLYFDGRYCCLGVAEHVRTGKPINGLTLTPEGCDYYGIDNDPKLLTKQHGRLVAASFLNDRHGWSFNRIANAIERTFNL